MKDTDKLKKISEIIRNSDKEEFDYQTIYDTIESITDINTLYVNDNVLKIVCEGYCVKVISNLNGGYDRIFDEADFNFRKKIIDLILIKNIDKNYKFGRYSAPLLFFVEDPNIFEYLCSIGFDPNERIKISDYEGRPYFSLHHDFSFDIYLIAKKYGFNKNEKTKDNDEIIHLIFNRFIEFDTNSIEFLSKEFESTINVPMRSGLSCLQKYVINSDVSKYMIEMINKMLEFGFDKNYKAEKEIEFSEFIFPKGSTALDIFKIKCNNYKYDQTQVSQIEQLLKPTDTRDKKKWWKF